MSAGADGPDPDDPDEIAREDAAAAALYARLDALGIGYAHHAHPRLYTVEQSVALRGDLPGVHVKNMFLKEKKGGLWLVTCREDRQVRIRDLEKAIGAKGCSFAKPPLLWEALGVRPGAVTPFAVLNDGAGRVRVALDEQVLATRPINAHPLHNRATAAISPTDLSRFLAATGHEPVLVDFDALEALAGGGGGGS